MSEFDLIATYFTWDSPKQATGSIVKGIGDDAAVLALKPNQHLVTSIDTLVSGVHFPEDTSAYDVGYKALAVNLSDLAAMGAKPEWFTLALTLPHSKQARLNNTGADHQWLAEFSCGLKTLAQAHEIALVGGDTTSGPLSISIQVMGSVESGKAIYRHGARPSDKLYVTGTLGDGGAGLASIKRTLNLPQEYAEYCQTRLNKPSPRLVESQVIAPFASACIDVSDGLLQDLSHILNQSSQAFDQLLGAQLDLSQIPFSPALKSIDNQQALNFALQGGDDYELLFTVPEDKEAAFLEAVASLSQSNSHTRSYQFSCIGTIAEHTNTETKTASKATNIDDHAIVDIHGNPLNASGYNHFS